MRFVEFWHDLTDHDPQWLYFDSKVVPYCELANLNQRKIWWLILRFGGSIGEYHPKLLCDRHLWRDFVCSSNLL